MTTRLDVLEDIAPDLSVSDEGSLERVAATLEAQAAALRALALDAARPQAIRIRDLARRWGVSRGQILQLVTHKRLRSFRVGKAICIPLAEVERYERRRAS